MTEEETETKSECRDIMTRPEGGSMAQAFLEAVKAGYANDPDTIDDLKTRGRRGAWTQQDGLWFRNGALVLPRQGTLRQECMEQHHDPPARGHPGVRRTLLSIRKYYWWSSMEEDVHHYVATCDLCQRMKSGSQRPAGLMQPLPLPPATEKAKHWVMDYAVKLPRTARGNDSILIMVSRDGKYVLARACAYQHPTSEVIRTMRDATTPFGVPFSLVVDSDSRFTSKEFIQWTEDEQCKLHTASVDHHETVGLAERSIQAVKQHLRFYVDAQQTNWDELLSAAQSALNNAHCESLGCSPSYLMYGMDPARPQITAPVPDGHSPHSEWMRAAERARQRLEDSRERMLTQANAKRRDVQYLVGDKVLLSTRHPWFATMDGVRKLIPRWVGPFPVVEVTHKVTCTLELPADMKCSATFHVALLKHYHPLTRRLDTPPPQEVEGYDEYEVEAILKHRDRNRWGKDIREYRVAFKGYGPHRNLWLPEENLTHCPEAIAEYHRRVQAKIGVRAIRTRNN